MTSHARGLYVDLKKALLENFQLEPVQKKLWASFRLKQGTGVCDVIRQQNNLLLVYTTFHKRGILPLDDFIKDISGQGHHGKGDYCSYIGTKSDVSRAVEYVGHVYRDVSGSV